MTKKLVLFDIDGTLLSVGSINRRVLCDALREVYGTEGTACSCNFAGKMDSGIIYEALRPAGLDDEEIGRKFNQARQTYCDLFRQHASLSDITLMAGVHELLQQLSLHTDLLLGLLTGNFEESGRHKLTLPGLNHYFPFGAFADDGYHRNELPPVAVEKAYSLTGKTFTEKNIVIIGDTEHDITCARVLNARSIAVATGTYSMRELRKHQPDVLLEDLSQPETVLREILKTSTT
ncbi:HAD family hydrolase [Chlorobium phaeovibrioides]|uniref:phosphoglycolate phosphatase n=2 Tax=Chlorobium phaeovibrioides TaxID=1094 RepID=A0A3S0L1L5_CHLPH|nr:HAD hydrolase-like protein [Chlorobium phaeovibrioides]HCD36028.1 hydrolase [Chlorobium sp.]KAA6233080.1 HAD family hydrolase [Chlorobium phaeovibrioides]QEQ56530.1 HAD family hydrolase [Chlorobium phaeovibrioides]RTY35819.1 HAD family hydrolase [Chlorobium phaeovibrioides]RTY39130.1 HAD family hydrolase [Chlorobium phaeovibrioides]